MDILIECLVCELPFGSRRVCVVSIYQTPNQASNACDTFLVNFDKFLTFLKSLKPYVLSKTDDFNVGTSSR